MCDGNVHLVIGKVSAEVDGSDLVLVAERVFKFHTDDQAQAFKAERAGIAAVEMTASKKRHAVDLVQETPNKGEEREVGLDVLSRSNRAFLLFSIFLVVGTLLPRIYFLFLSQLLDLSVR